MQKNARNSVPRCLLVAVLATGLVIVGSQVARAAGSKGKTATPPVAQQRPTVDLTPSVKDGDLRHVKVLFELDGTLALKSEARTPVKLPVQAKAELIYDEKVLQGATTDLPWARSSVRHYETAKATVKFRDSVISPTLREDRSVIAFSAIAAEDATLFSPLGPLSRDELDLLDVPGNSALLSSLLPHRRVAVGESWQLQSDILPALLGVDVLQKHDIQCSLERVDGVTALIHARGTADGATGGVDTTIHLAWKLNFHLERKCVTWFAMSFKEDRSVGHAQPGIAGMARVQMTLEPRTQAASLHPAILADLNLAADDSNRLVEFTSIEGGFELLLSRNWHEMVDREDRSILRMVDHGDLIAQCNITALPPMEDGVPFTLADFQQDIQNVLDTNFGEFVTATEAVNDNDLHVMRVVTAGTASELPITWIYYHVTNRAGRRISCVFTHESTLADRFGGTDHEVISSLRFRDRP